MSIQHKDTSNAKVVKWLLSFLFFALPSLSLTAQQLTDKYDKEHPVVIVCDWDKPPYEYLNDKGQPTGSNIDVMQAVMKQLGLPCRFVMKEWSIALKTFERGNADLILANARRYHRAPYVISENIINYNRIRVAMHSDSVGMIPMRKLEQEGAVFKPGDYSAYYFIDGDTINTSFMEFQTPKVALMGLINGDYKYYIWGEEPLKWKIKELNLEGITLNDVSIPISEIHVVGRDRQLIESIDDQYSRLKQSGEIENLQNRWFHPERVQGETSPVVIYIILAILLLAAIFYLFNRLAKAHVRSVTRNSSELNEMMYKALHMGNFNVMEYDIANDRMTNRYGHILPEDGLTLKEFTERIHPDQQQEFSQKMGLLMVGRERRFELNKRWNTGTLSAPKWLNFQGHAISELDNNGRPAYIVNAIHDVTHEMEEDKAGRELVKKYDCLANLSFVAMSFYDRNGWLIDLNDSMKELCGFNSEDESSSTDAERYWRSLNMFDIPLFRNALSTDARDNLIVCQHMYYPEIGVNRYIEFHVLPLVNADGEIANYFDSTIEITEEHDRDQELHQIIREEKKTRDRIEQQKVHLNYLLHNSERYLMRSSIKDNSIAFYRSLDTPEYVHELDSFINVMVAEQDRATFRQLLYDTTTDVPQRCIIHLIKHSDNQLGTVFDITLNPVKDADGNIIGHEGISSDITPLHTARQHLQDEILLAKDSVRLKSGFMASMTHELRTPLNAIVGFTGVLESLGESDERTEFVRIIRNSSDMLQRLINDIIEASSLTDGPTTIQPADVNFVAAFEDICLTLQQRVQASGLTFIKENPYNTFRTTVDIGRIQQVLTNFVTNAVKFTKEGHIRLGYRYEQHGLYLYCEDTGIGIPKDKQEHIFDRFVKLDEFTQGTGMGLAICKSIAERCQGKIGLISEGIGKGCTFWTWIPCERRLS